jgi:hypothetical protein
MFRSKNRIFPPCFGSEMRYNYEPRSRRLKSRTLWRAGGSEKQDAERSKSREAGKQGTTAFVGFSPR